MLCRKQQRIKGRRRVMTSLCSEDCLLKISTRAALSVRNTLVYHKTPPHMFGKGNWKEFETSDINTTIQATHKTKANQKLSHNPSTLWHQCRVVGWRKFPNDRITKKALTLKLSRKVSQGLMSALVAIVRQIWWCALVIPIVSSIRRRRNAWFRTTKEHAKIKRPLVLPKDNCSTLVELMRQRATFFKLMGR